MTASTFGQCSSCKAYCRLIGPYWQPGSGVMGDPELHPHFHCIRCGSTRVPVAKNPAGREVHYSVVDRERFKAVAA